MVASPGEVSMNIHSYPVQPSISHLRIAQRWATCVKFKLDNLKFILPKINPLHSLWSLQTENNKTNIHRQHN